MGNAVDVSDLIDRNPVGRFQKWAIALCAAVAILDGFDTQAIAFVAPVIAQQWGMEVSAFGPIFGAGLLGLTIGALVFGPVADRIGRKKVIVLSTVIFGLFALASAWAESFWQLLALRLLTGIGLGGAMPNIIALTSEYAPKRSRATLVTLMFCGFPLGAVLGGLVSSKLMPAFGWQSVFHLGGILPLLLAPVLVAWLPESIRFLVGSGAARAKVAKIVGQIDPQGSHGPERAYVMAEDKVPGLPIRQLFTEGRAFATSLLWVVFFCNLLILYFLINWLPSVLQQAGLPIERAIVATVILNAGGIVGGLLLGRMVDKRGPYGILGIAYLLAAVSVAGIGLWNVSVAVIMGTVFVAGFFVIGAQFCMNALAASYYPTAIRSTGVGWALGIGRIGSIVGPVVGGIVLGLEWAAGGIFMAAAIPALISAGAVALIGLQARPRMPAAAAAAE